MSELYIRLGKALKLERQGKNLPITQLADQLKTSETTLERVEEGDLSSFSSPVYFSLYAKSYAEALGVDYVRTLDAIRDDLGESAEPVAPATLSKTPVATAPAADSPAPYGKRKPLWLFISLLVVVVAVVVTWIVLSGIGGKSATPVIATPPQSFIPPAADSLATAMADTSVITLSLAARGSSWVALMTDGDTALFRTFSAGETLEVSAIRQMILTVGTPAQIDLKLNGHPVKLADRSGRIASVVITPANVRAYTGVSDTTAQLKSADSVKLSPGSNPVPAIKGESPNVGSGR
jgi:transcriptional regulator with XRE-family HTH domain